MSRYSCGLILLDDHEVIARPRRPPARTGCAGRRGRRRSGRARASRAGRSAAARRSVPPPPSPHRRRSPPAPAPRRVHGCRRSGRGRGSPRRRAGEPPRCALPSMATPSPPRTGHPRSRTPRRGRSGGRERGGIEAAEEAREGGLMRRHALREAHRPLARRVLLRAPLRDGEGREMVGEHRGEGEGEQGGEGEAPSPVVQRGSATAAKASTSGRGASGDAAAALQSGDESCVDGIVRSFGWAFRVRDENPTKEAHLAITAAALCRECISPGRGVRLLPSTRHSVV